MKPKKRFYSLLTGTVLVAVCCFTPVLVVGLGLVGLSLFVPYLDYFLWPALVILVVLTILSYRKYKAGRGETDQKYYVCGECGLKYESEGIRNQCQAWCKEHQSCNLEIIKHAVRD